MGDSTMSLHATADYIFGDAAGERELQRLRALEAIFDPATLRRILHVGDLLGKHCLEVGAGAGSIARYLSQHVGSTGRVVAVDTSTRFLRELSDIELVEAKLTEAALEPRSFDLVHGRYVAIHNADFELLIEAMLRALRPGGWLVLEEPDFRAARSVAGPAALRETFDSVNRAILELFTSRGMAPDLGAQLPLLLERRGVQLEAVELEPHTERGGSPLAAMMRLSTEALASKYVATGRATESDIAGYREFTESPLCFGVYYTSVSVVGKLPG
jgi:SAM-dependent methyltransferase